MTIIVTTDYFFYINIPLFYHMLSTFKPSALPWTFEKDYDLFDNVSRKHSLHIDYDLQSGLGSCPTNGNALDRFFKNLQLNR